MKYDEAINLLFKTPWKVTTCLQGKKCWCRIIVPVNEITYEGSTDSLSVIDSGAISNRTANYIVKLHNKNLKELKNERILN